MLTIDDQQLNVIDRGSGTPILFVHGFPLQAAMWDYQIEAVTEAGYRAVAVDLPGFGGSAPPAEPSAVTIDAYADLVAGVARELGIDKVILVGLSMGGYVAFAVARRHPEMLAGLILADTRAQADDGNTWQDRTDQQQSLRNGEPLESLAKSMVEKVLGRPALRHQELVDYVVELMTGNAVEGVIGALEAMKDRPDSMMTLAQVDVPTLVLVGSQDRLTPLIEANLIRSKIADAELVTIPEAGHLANLENPYAFNDAVLAFLEKIASPASMPPGEGSAAPADPAPEGGAAA